MCKNIKHLVYIHTNKTNGKVYIGVTGKTLKNRWSGHVRKAKYMCKKDSGTYFQRAIVKYGQDNWNSEILEVCKSLKNAEIAEIKWIKYYDSNNKDFGYNLTKGGNVSQSFFDPRVRQKISTSVTKIMSDPLVRERHSKAMKEWYKHNVSPSLGKRHSEESKLANSNRQKEWHKHHKNPFKGKKHTEESRNKMSQAAKERCLDSNWQSPSVKYGFSDEVRRRMSESAKNRVISSKVCTKQELLDLAIICKTQLEIANKLNCTSANISYLSKRWKIRDALKKALKN